MEKPFLLRRFQGQFGMGISQNRHKFYRLLDFYLEFPYFLEFNIVAIGANIHSIQITPGYRGPFNQPKVRKRWKSTFLDPCLSQEVAMEISQNRHKYYCLLDFYLKISLYFLDLNTLAMGKYTLNLDPPGYSGPSWPKVRNFARKSAQQYFVWCITVVNQKNKCWGIQFMPASCLLFVDFYPFPAFSALWGKIITYSINY